MTHDSTGNLPRRAVLGAGAAVIGWAVPQANAAETSPAATPGPDDIVVTLIGTGSPVPLADRFGMSTLVQAGGLDLLFDAGRNCAVRLNQVHVRLGKIDTVFITHFHSDHLNGLPDVWMTSYLPAANLNRTNAMEIIGPKGIARIAATMRDTFADDIRIRMADQKVPEVATQLVTHEFTEDGVVFERNGVKVTAFEVNHGALIKPACGYRIDYAGKSVLLSGDTKFDENLIAHGKGVDLLVHEVAVAPKPIIELSYIQVILNHHTTPEEAGTVFTRTNPKLAVFSHISKLADEKNPPPPDSDIAQRARTTWGGDLVVGLDLDRFVVSASGVATKRFDFARGAYPA